ncbi:MAG: NAD(P)H-hydrate dehydratase [Lachnospiraceae bacterium]|nr:NAD(P)H-hydrate dehydratase [Lachnospiraceae bacterium]
MEYLVSQAEMKQYDKNTIEYYKVPSVVLMERAALVTVEAIRKEKGDGNFRVLVVSGCGNNGGDGLAVGRLFMLQGCKVEFVLLGKEEKCSEETALQLAIVKQYGNEIYDRIPEAEYDIVIDAIFGIGLSRAVEGIFKEAIGEINRKNTYVCAVDIPSGIHGDSGQVMGCAVQADLTVTYGFRKLGHCFYPGATYCGKIICGQMGIDDKSFLGQMPFYYTYTGLADVKLPVRKADGNKGTFGKVLVVAGNETMCGAALMAAKSVFRVGAGMVRVVTSAANRELLQQALPEAMITAYDNFCLKKTETEEMCDIEKVTEKFEAEFEKALNWADCILIGPGIGTGPIAKWLLHSCLQKSTLPMVMDADALNLLAEESEAIDTNNWHSATTGENSTDGRKIILTPHMGEFARLFGCSVAEAKKNLLRYPKQLADKTGCIIVCKDARTVVALPDEEEQYINTSGNAGMATAGSGDVLAGVITGLLAQGIEVSQAAISGVYLHGLAGDEAAARLGERSMMATDIIEQLTELLRNG